MSFSEYTEPAIKECRNALNRNVVVVLATLEEIAKLLENEVDLKERCGNNFTSQRSPPGHPEKEARL